MRPDGSFGAQLATAGLANGSYRFGVLDEAQKVVAAGSFAVAGKPASVPSADGLYFRTFGLAVPGVVYTTDNYATNTRTVTVASGTVTKSAVRINPDGTYVWNSAWDGKIIRGQWRRDGSAIILMKAQSGLDWRMEQLPKPLGKAVVSLWDQNSISYHGTPLD